MTNLIPLAIADVELQLATSVAVAATSFSLSSANDDDGNALPAGMYCFTVDSGTSNKEYLLGQLNGTSVTGVSRVSRQGVSTSGAAKAHRIGAPVILTNFATLQRVADILRGQIALDGGNPINYDAEPSLTGRTEIATVGYVLDTATGGTVAFDTQIITGVNAGETVADGDFLYFKTSDQEWYKADASVVATSENVQIGIAQGAGTDGAAISGGVLISGVHTTTGLTAGSSYYISDTAGAIAATAGTVEVLVGTALSTTKLLLQLRTAEMVTATEKDALAGTSGTPSTSNRFVTDADTTGTGSLLRANKQTKRVTSTDINTVFGGETSNPEEDILVTAIPAGALGTNNYIRVKIWFTLLNVKDNAYTQDFQFFLKYGSTTITSVYTLHSSNGGIGESRNGSLEAYVFANNSASVQFGHIEFLSAPLSMNDTATSPVSTGSLNSAFGTASEDSSGALNLTISVNPGDTYSYTVTARHALVELITA